MRGGELLEKIHQEKSLSERESAHIMFVIIKTIEQLHRNSIGKKNSFLRILLEMIFACSTSRSSTTKYHVSR